jgi:MtrB/PioB family decaheme-associated outer membrane protein
VRPFPLLLAVAVVACLPWRAAGEQTLGPLVVSGQAQLGGRGVFGDTDSGKFEEYRDVQEGAFGSLHFLLEDGERRYYLQGWLDDIGERDQQYRFRLGRYGFWGVSGLYSEIPHVFSNGAVSPYTRSGSLFELPAAWDFVLDPGDAPDPITGLNDYQQQLVDQSDPVRLRFRTIEGSGEAFVKPIPELTLRAGYHLWDRDHSRALSLGFGSAGGVYANVAAPIRERTHEARVDAEYQVENWSLGLNYTGSFFENDFDSFSVNNPLNDVAVDGTTDVGRSSLAPDNSAHLVSLSGAGILPTGFPARLAGTFSWGVHRQTDDFLPATSNSALPGSPDDALCPPSPSCLILPQGDLDGWVQTILGNLVFTARPLPSLNLKARYRIYDYDNQSDVITLLSEVVNDQSIRAVPVTSVANSYRRQNALLEASWRLAEPVTGTLGFEWEHWNRSQDREVRNQNSYGPVARIDWRAASWARLRGSYGFSARRGNDYVAEPGALAGLRKYSQADRVRHRFELLTQLDPREDLGFTFSSGFSLNDYDDSDQGVTDDNRWNVGLDASYRPLSYLGFWAYYHFDYIWAFQKQSGGSWDSTTYDTAHNASVGVDFGIVPDRLDGEVSYFIQLARANTLGSGSAVDFPTIDDTLQAVSVGLNLYALEYLSFRALYRFEKYDRNNFHEDFPISDSQGDIYLQNRVADYDAHIVSLSAILSF